MRIQSAVFPLHYVSVRILRTGLLALSLVLAAACSDDDASPPAAGTIEENPPRVLGRVLSTPDQIASASDEGIAVRLLALLSPSAQAAIPGLAPAPGVQVELLRVDDAGAPSGAPLATVTSDADGVFAIERLPAAGMLMLRASLRTEVLRAFVTDENTDLTPASELAVRRVGSGMGEGNRLSDFSRAELAALAGYLDGLRVAAGVDLGATITRLDTQAGSPFASLLQSFRDGGDAATVGEGDYGTLEFTSTLRDPALSPGEDLAAGIDAASGVGMITLDADARAVRAFVPRAVYVQGFSGGAPSEDAAQDVIAAGDLRGQTHVTAADGRALVLDPGRPAVAAVPGAAVPDGSLMVHPLVLALDRPAGLVAAGAGLRFVAPEPEPAFTGETLTRIDPLGGEATQYHLLRMFHAYVPGGEATIVVGAASGSASFDSSPQSRAFTGDAAPSDYGGFAFGAGRSPLAIDPQLGLVSAADPGTALPANGLFRLVPGTGLLELRADDDGGSHVGTGLLSADAQVLVMEMAGAAEDGLLERALMVAVRRSEGDAPPPVAGFYHVVGYANRVQANEAGVFLGSVVRHGALRLNAEDGLVDEVDLFSREFRLEAGDASSDEPIEALAMAETASVPGTYVVDESGAVRLELTIERADGALDRLVAAGAADRSGNFIALAVRSEGDAGEGRGLLFLVRRGDDGEASAGASAPAD